MRKLTVHMQVTLDGRISRPDGMFWEPFPWGDVETEYLNPVFADAGGWVMSRRLYEFVVPYWEQVAAGTAPASGIADSPARDEFARILTGLDKIVLSTTLGDDPATRRSVISGDVAARIHELKASEGHDLIGSFGPATLGPLADEPGLIDEYLVVVHPAVLTAGPRLFDHLSRDLALELVDSRIFGAGASLLHYRVLERP